MTLKYFQENGIKTFKFDNYVKGHHELGSLIEICVKMSKKLIFSSIGNNILNLREFEFIIAQANHLINRRPVAFKEGLRDSSGNAIPDPITPEILIHGHELISVNSIPGLHSDSDLDLDWLDNSNIDNNYKKLKIVRNKIIECYHNEFLLTLANQASDRQGRFKPVSHKLLHVGDIVLIKEDNLKPSQYPMGIIHDINVNILGEITHATILKAKTKEIIQRHSSKLIPYLTITDFRKPDLTNYANNLTTTNAAAPAIADQSARSMLSDRPQRIAAAVAKDRIKRLSQDS